MPLVLTHPFVAWLLPAVSLPILFHLFFRLRRQNRDFPSLMFFTRIDPRLSAKRKLHEWIILALRCLFLLLLILALARPLLGIKTSSEKTARLVLIDNSGSMAALTTATVSKLTLAERAAQKFISATEKGDEIGAQLMLPDPTASIPSGFEAAPAAISDAVGKITPSDGAAVVPKAIRLALSTLDGAKSSQRELHIVTDLQQKNWTKGEVDAEANNTRVIIHRIESLPVAGGSVSLSLLETPSRAIPAGRITPIRVALKNEGPGAAHVRLNGTDDSGKNFTKEVDVAPGATNAATVTFSFTNAGFHWGQVWLEGDAAPTANRAEIGFWITDVQKVLFLGQQDDYGAMPYAISPGGNSDLSGIETTYVGPGELAASLANKPLAVVLTWENWPQDGGSSAALQQYVREGGTLFVLPAFDGGPSAAMAPPAWLDAESTLLVTSKEPEPVSLLQEGDPVWRDLLDADGHPKLGTLRTFQYRPIKVGTGWQILISSSKGATLLARRDLDKGHIYVSGLAFIPKWSSLPLKAGFVVLMQNAIFGDQSEHIPVQSIRAAEEIHFDFLDGLLGLKSLAGSALDWQGKVKDFEGLPHTGVYQINQRDHVNWVVVSGNSDEADPHYLPRGLVPLLHNMPHEVVPLVNEDDMNQTALVQNSGASLYRWLMLLALLILLLETFLANERSSDMGKKLFTSLIPSSKPKAAAPKKAAELTRV
jgi:hypothetical protein